MAEVKQASFRLNEDGIDKFKELTTENGYNQAEMFDKLIENFKTAKSKGAILDRAKEVEVFENTATTLVSMFVNSLTVNQNAEETIRTNLSQEIGLKDTTIKDLQEQKENLKAEASTSKESSEILKKQNKEFIKELDSLKAEFLQKTNTISSQLSQISTLNAIIAEYKEYKDINVKLEKQNKELLLKDTALEHSNVDLEGKIKNLEQMIDFYKEEINGLKQDKIEIAKQLKETEAAHKTELQRELSFHKAELDTLKNEKNEIAKQLKDAGIMYKTELQAEKKSLDLELSTELAKVKKDYEANLQLEKGKMDLKMSKLVSKNDILEEKYNNLVTKTEENKIKTSKQTTKEK